MYEDYLSCEPLCVAHFIWVVFGCRSDECTVQKENMRAGLTWIEERGSIPPLFHVDQEEADAEQEEGETARHQHEWEWPKNSIDGQKIYMYISGTEQRTRFGETAAQQLKLVGIGGGQLNVTSRYQRFLLTGIQPSSLDALHNRAAKAPVATDHDIQRPTRSLQPLKSSSVVPAWTPRNTWKILSRDPEMSRNWTF